MRKLIIVFLSCLGLSLSASAQMDTLRISADYTTHVIFSTDLVYADLSNNRVVAAKIIEQNKNMFALKARLAFEEYTSISALESNGTMHTFIVCYDPNPKELVVDMRAENRVEPRYQAPVADMINTARDRRPEYDRYQPEGANVSTWKAGKAPLLKDVAQYEQKLFHLSDKEYDIQVLCEDISSHSDITYITLSLRNRSGISYAINDASFVVESKSSGKRTVKYENSLLPRSRYGTLAAGPGEYSRIVYSFDKMTLSKDQVLKIYFYEQGGQRNLVLTLDTKDINKARRTSM